MRIILLGKPGVGKGTQAGKLAKALSIPKISTGDMLRAEAKSGSKLGQTIKHLIDAGQLVSDEIMIDLVRVRLAQPDCASGFLFDGYPRTLAQAQALAALGMPIDYVIDIVLSDEAVIKRLSGRRVHPASGRTYHLIYHPPKVDNRDDATSELLIQREDDKEAVICARLQVYQKQTQPLQAYYQQSSVKYLTISGEGSIEIVYQHILDALEKMA